jgi:hypothetical protein
MGSREVFEELGILDTEAQTNPFETIGISSALATELLREDPSGADLKLAAKGLHRALSQLWHPDVDQLGENTDKFLEVQAANERISTATPASLHRWTKVAGVDSKKIKEEYEKAKQDITDRATNIYESMLSDVDHPLNFRRFKSSNGLVLKLPDSIVLMRAETTGETSITKGRSTIYTANASGFINKDTLRYASSLNLFLRQLYLDNRLDRQVKTIYLSGNDDMFLYGHNFSLLAETGAELVSTREVIEAVPKEVSPFWMRADYPQLIELQCDNQGTLEAARINSFRALSRFPDHRVDTQMKWLTDYKVVGSTPNVDFIRELITDHYAAPRQALSTSDEVTNLPILLQPFKSKDLFNKNSEYTPLLLPGNLILLKNTVDEQYSISTAEIVGLLEPKSTGD